MNNKLKIFSIVLILFFFITAKSSANECKEGFGAFIVFKASEILSLENISIEKEDTFVNTIYPILTGCTFPVNTDNTIRYKGYNPKESDTVNLIRELKKHKFGVIFLPRTIYDLMYFQFCKSADNKKSNKPVGTNIDTNSAIRYTGVTNAEEYNKNRMKGIEDIINNTDLKRKYYHFNNWALKFIWDNIRINEDKFKNCSSPVYISSEILKEEVIRLLMENLSTSEKYIEDFWNIFQQAVEMECKVRDHFILYRAIPGGKDGLNWILYKEDIKEDKNEVEKEVKKEDKKYTCIPYSVSYNHGLFGGYGHDDTACTLKLFKDALKKDPKIPGYMLVINKKQYLENNPDSFSAQFYIPPLPIIATFYAGGELWHPRTRVMIPEKSKQCSNGNPEIKGIAMVSGRYLTISDVLWLQLNNKKEKWSFDKIEAEAKYHEGIVRMNGINFETEIKIVVDDGSDGGSKKVIIIE